MCLLWGTLTGVRRSRKEIGVLIVVGVLTQVVKDNRRLPQIWKNKTGKTDRGVLLRQHV